jgi:hypothetical protein
VIFFHAGESAEELQHSSAHSLVAISQQQKDKELKKLASHGSQSLSLCYIYKKEGMKGNTVFSRVIFSKGMKLANHFIFRKELNISRAAELFYRHGWCVSPPTCAPEAFHKRKVYEIFPDKGIARFIFFSLAQKDTFRVLFHFFIFFFFRISLLVLTCYPLRKRHLCQMFISSEIWCYVVKLDLVKKKRRGGNKKA